MDINKIFKNHREKVEEIMEKATGCNSTDELLTLAKEYSIEIDAAQAEEILALIRQPSLLSEEELAQVAGGKNRGQYCPYCGSTDIGAARPYVYICNKCNRTFNSSDDPRNPK